MLRTINNIGTLKGKKVLLRTDFDVPVAKEEVTEPFRIQKQKKTIDHLLAGGARVAMAAHIASLPSFQSVMPQIEKILGRKVRLIGEISDFHNADESLCLLDNVRRYSGEEKNDMKFSKDLAKRFDIYVNNAFAVCHRNHASVSGVTEFLKSYAGFIVEEEVRELGKCLDAPMAGKVVIMGGAKASTKIPVIKNFINKAEKILVAGVIANDILKEKGTNVLGSVADSDSKQLLSGLDMDSSKLVLPEDFNEFEGRFLDIGPKTISNYVAIINGAKMIIWNGPMGVFEDSRFSGGTEAVAKAIAGSGAFKVVGGGDSVAAMNKFNILDKFDFVSTGGGAMLEFFS